MTEPDVFTDEPVIGHHVEAEVVEPDSQLGEALQAAAEDFDHLTPRDRRHVKITVGDVSWDEMKTLSLPIQTVARLCEWFESTIENQ